MKPVAIMLKEVAVSLVRCPVCEQPFEVATAKAMPFCSDRCRQIDLGRWLRESYSVPVEREERLDDEAETD